MGSMYLRQTGFFYPLILHRSSKGRSFFFFCIYLLFSLQIVWFYCTILLSASSQLMFNVQFFFFKGKYIDVLSNFQINYESEDIHHH